MCSVNKGRHLCSFFFLLVLRFGSIYLCVSLHVEPPFSTGRQPVRPVSMLTLQSYKPCGRKATKQRYNFLMTSAMPPTGCFLQYTAVLILYVVMQ